MPKVLTAANQDFACVFHQGKGFVCYLPKPGPVAWTATFKLVQNIFEEFKDHSFFILRNRIFTSTAENELDRGLVKVTAKRIRFSVSENDQELVGLWNQTSEVIEIGRDQSEFHSRYKASVIFPDEEKIVSYAEGFNFLNRVIQSNQPQGFEALALHDRNRNVGAMLLSPKRQVLAYALNSSSINKTLHAEINLIQEFVRTRGLVPLGCTLLVTHKPCKMCSGAIFSAAESPQQLKVFYQIEERGTHSTSTVLDRFQINRPFIE